MPSITQVPSEKTVIPLAVVGAHLSGLPLNKDLLSRGATLHECTKTSNAYKFYALTAESGPARPGLKRVTHGEKGNSIEVEIWNLPTTEFASFMGTIPSPLAIGKIEVLDGTWVSGFVCEPYGLASATDITEFGGWRNYIAQLK